jgi:hypothetical protein
MCSLRLRGVCWNQRRACYGTRSNATQAIQACDLPASQLSCGRAAGRGTLPWHCPPAHRRDCCRGASCENVVIEMKSSVPICPWLGARPLRRRKSGRRPGFVDDHQQQLSALYGRTSSRPLATLAAANYSKHQSAGNDVESARGAGRGYGENLRSVPLWETASTQDRGPQGQCAAARVRFQRHVPAICRSGASKALVSGRAGVGFCRISDGWYLWEIA